MRMINMDKKESISCLQLYLTIKEASEFKDGLEKLLENPEANEHIHIYSKDMHYELSFSIITDNKLNNINRYTKLEQKILLGE